MKIKTRTLAAFLAMALAVAALGVLVACSSQATQRESEKLDVNADSAQKVNVETEPFYVLITGNDTRVGTSQANKPMYADGNARTDTMMLARVNPKNYLITLITIPRDTQDALADGSIVKINEHYNHGGIEETLEAVKNLTGVTPKYYFNTTFVNFEKLVDKLGGIHTNVPLTVTMKDIVSGQKMTIPSGEQDLNGAETLIYARTRHDYEDQLGLTNMEAYRQTADRKIMRTIVQKILSDASSVEGVTDLLYGCLDTNWDLASLKYIAKDFADHADQVSFLSGTGPYSGDFIGPDGIWLAYRDEDTWAQVIDVANQDGDPSTVVDVLSIE